MKVSIIVPVYNVERYLEKCLDSIINQTYSNIEIIIVNDGSTDSSYQIIKRFVEIDNRITYLYKQNGGLMSAWKLGVTVSSGNYIGFVDSDDWIDSNMYEVMIKHALSYNAEVVACSLIREYERNSNKTEYEQSKLVSGFYTRNGIETKILNGIINDGYALSRILSPNRVTKLIQRDLLLNNLEYLSDNVSLGEDLLTILSIMCDARNLYITDGFYPYHYRINDSSLTGNYDTNRILKVNILSEELKKIAQIKNIDLSWQIANDYISLTLLCIDIEIDKSKLKRKNLVNRLNKILSDSYFYDSITVGSFNKFPIKYQLYIFLIKKRMLRTLIVFRKTLILIKKSLSLLKLLFFSKKTR